jgi:filamentous hemagglutinin
MLSYLLHAIQMIRRILPLNACHDSFRKDTTVSKVLVAGYQKFMEGNLWGLTNSGQAFVELMNRYGIDGLVIAAHSRGAMTVGNALEALAANSENAGMLSGTTLSFYGPAYSAQQAAGLLEQLSGGRNSVVMLESHESDFVGSLIGRNPATWNQIPVGSSMFQEWIRMFGNAPTVHSCYGIGQRDEIGRASCRERVS